MTFAPLNSQAPFLSASTVLPIDKTELLTRLTNLFNDYAFKINIREISWYEKTELLTGQSWFTAINTIKRQPFRVVVEFPVLVDPGTTSVPHNILPFPVAFTRILATVTNVAGSTATCLAYPEIDIDAVNVNINLAAGTFNGASALVVLEYLKN